MNWTWNVRSNDGVLSNHTGRPDDWAPEQER